MVYWVGLHVLYYVIYYLFYRVIFCIKMRESIAWFVGVLVGSCVIMSVINELGIFSYGGKAIALTCVIALMILIKENRIRAILLFPVAFLMAGAIHILFSYLISSLFKIPYKEYLDSDLFKLLTEIPLLFGLILLWICRRKKEGESLIQFSIPKYFIILLGSCCIFFLVAVTQGMVLGKADFSLLAKPIAISFVIVGILFLILVIWQFLLEKRNHQYQMENAYYRDYLEKQETHIRDIIEADHKIRSFRHDIRAHLIALESGAEKGDIEFLRQYIARMKQENNGTSVYEFTGIVAVDAVIVEWHEKTLKNHIEWNWEGSRLNGTNMEPFDLCVIFSNLLSNAFEAALQVEDEGERRVHTYCGIYQKNLIVRVSNSCREDVKRAEETGTTKKDKNTHGFGIKNVQDVVNKYHGTMNSKVGNKTYEVEIMVSF